MLQALAVVVGTLLGGAGWVGRARFCWSCFPCLKEGDV